MIELKIDSLYEAIKKQIAIELRPFEARQENVLFFSRFIDYDLEKSLINIDFPVVSEALGVLHEQDRVVVKFIYRESPFIFNATVMSSSSLEDSHTTRETPTGIPPKYLTLSLPDCLLGEERRNFLKVRTPPFAVTIKVIDSKDIVRKMKNKKYMAVVLNISGGGTGLGNESENLPFTSGDILDLDIDLPEEKIHIEGEVLNIYENETSGRMSFGIHFIQRKIDKLNFNKSVKSIVRYVMRRERELLSR